MKQLYLLLLVSSSVLLGMEDSRHHVLSIELDDIISQQAELGVSDFTSLKSSLSLWQVTKLAAKIPHLTSEYYKIEKSSHGVGNIFMALAAHIKDEHGVDIDDCVAKLIKIFAKPTIKPGALDALRKIREKHGIIILGTTHYDYAHFMAYLTKINPQAEDQFEDAFEGFVTACFNHLPLEKYQVDTKYVQPDAPKGVYMAQTSEAVTPKETDNYPLKTVLYFDVVRDVAQDIRASAGEFFHVDPSQQCVDSANSLSGFTAHCYDPTISLETQIENVYMKK